MTTPLSVTTAPVPATPGVAPTPPGSDAEASASTFAALVARLLPGPGTATEPAVPGGPPVPGGLPTEGDAGGDLDLDGAPESEEPTPQICLDPAAKQPIPPLLIPNPVPFAAPSATPSAAPSAVLVATRPGELTAPNATVSDPAPTAPGTPVTATAPPSVTEPTAATAPTSGTAPSAPAARAMATAPTSAVAPTPGPDPATAPAAPVAPAAAPVTDAGKAAPTASPAGTPQVAGSASVAVPETPPTPGAVSAATPGGLGQSSGPEPVPSPTAVPGPTTVPGPTAVISPATTETGRPVPHGVTPQVFPEIARLVAAGSGTHRVRLQLEPEALGEVRVLLTIRNGEVHVRLSAGDDAQRALLEGAPELRRLLEALGAGETRITVRDLAPGSASGAGTTSSTHGPGGDGSGRADHGTDHRDADGSRSRHAEPRGWDAPQGTTGEAVPLRPGPAGTDLRAAGVDVTM